MEVDAVGGGGASPTRQHQHQHQHQHQLQLQLQHLHQQHQQQQQSNSSASTLKRCSSAPLIARSAVPPLTEPAPPTRESSTVACVSSSPSPSSACISSISAFNSFGQSLQSGQPRTRRFSASFTANFGGSPPAHSPNSSGPRLTPRVSQLRQEECADVTNVREVAHERETHSAMQMSQSWEDLTLMTAATGAIGGPMSPTQARFSPGVSPSPTRRAFATRRSLSPIAMRPSCLSPVSRPSGLTSLKRRIDPDEAPSAKRCCWSMERLTPSTPGTPDSLSDSPSGFTFRPVSPRAPSLSSPLSNSQNHTSPSPS